MLYTNCYDAFGHTIDHYTQYDINQTIYIDIGTNDYTVKPIFFFSNLQSSKPTEVYGTINGTVVSAEVPNQLLAEPYPIDIYLYVTDPANSLSQKALLQVKIPVRGRVMPSSYSNTKNISCTGVSLDKSSATLKVGATLKLIATVTPYNTTQELKWTTSRSATATVEDGIVTGVASSSTAATITATCGNYSASCNVTVTS